MTKFVVLSILTMSLTMMGLAAQQSPSSTQQQTTQQQTAQQQPASPAPAAPPQAAHAFNLTPADKARQNPVRFTDISVARGKELYQNQCSMCHGDKGDGKGDLAEEMNITPPDFTNPSVLNQRADGELFAMIGQGLAPMPGQSKRLTATQTWDLVNFLRSLQGKTPATATPQEREQAKEAGTVAVPK